MATTNDGSTDLIYRLGDKPAFPQAIFAAIQHVLASFVGIITPTLIIGGVLGLGSEVPYLISMALIVSGVGTIIQAARPFGIGAGMICVQGTSFAFLSSVLAAGFIAKSRGGGSDEILSMIFTVCMLGAFVEIFLSQFLQYMKRVITPLVTGIVITIIGISLIKVGMTDMAGGFKAPDFGSMENLSLGALVLVSVIFFNQSSNQWLRLSSVVIGLAIGFVVAMVLGKVSFDNLANLPLVSIPQPFKYGFSFDFGAFIPIALIYFMTAIESTGDITANCMISGEPIKGESYLKRIKGGVLGDGVNSLLAAVFNTPPNTTFSQNNGVIQLTGIASRHVGYYIGGILMILGLFPVVGGVLQNMPKAVLGGATLVMFATIAAAGIKILAQVELNRRNMLIMAVAFGLGLGVTMVPDALNNLPDMAKNVLSSAITTGGLAAIILNVLFSDKSSEDASDAVMGDKVEEAA